MEFNTITSRKNPMVLHFKKLATSKKYRREQKKYLCDGDKLFFEAITYGANLSEIMVCDDAVLQFENKLQALSKGIKIYVVPREIIEAVSPSETPQNIVFSVEMPTEDFIAMGNKYVVCDALQDAGNMGTILRTACAFEFDGVVLVNNCVDVFSPKTVRAGMGANFRIPVFECDIIYLKERLLEKGIKLAAADFDDECQSAQDISAPIAIVIGNEGNGISDEVKSFCDFTVKIPMSENTESLNAGIAASILMWEVYKKQV